MSNALVPISDIERMASAVAKSGLFGIKTPEQGVALMLIAQAEGLHPAIAARDYHVIQNRPALKTDAMLARFQQAGGKVSYNEYTESCVSATFSHPAGGSITVEWTMEMARKAGLAGKDNWKNYPRAMLRARVISEGIRTVFPGCVVGTYSVEEVQDFDDAPRASQKPARRTVEVSDVSEAVLTGEKPVEAPAGSIPLFVPGVEDAFSRHEGVDEWIEAYAALVKKIVNSSKLSEEARNKKQAGLEEANKLFIAAMTAMDRMHFRAAIAGAGSASIPKAPPSTLTDEEEAFENAQQQTQQDHPV